MHLNLPDNWDVLTAEHWLPHDRAYANLVCKQSANRRLTQYWCWLQKQLSPGNCLHIMNSVSLQQLNKLDAKGNFDNIVFDNLLMQADSPESILTLAVNHLADNGKLIIVVPFAANISDLSESSWLLTDLLKIIPANITITSLDVTNLCIRFVGKKGPQPDQKTITDHDILTLQQQAFIDALAYFSDLLAYCQQQYRQESENHHVLQRQHIQLERQLELAINRKYPKSTQSDSRFHYYSRWIKQKWTTFIIKSQWTSVILVRKFLRVPAAVNLKVFIKHYTRHRQSLLKTLKQQHIDQIAILYNRFPALDNDNYGGGFILSRLRGYQSLGIKGLVIDIRDQYAQPYIEDIPFGACLRVSTQEWLLIHKAVLKRFSAIYAHSPEPAQIEQLSRLASDSSKIAICFHGAEIRDYRRLHYNWTTEEMASQHRALVKAMSARINAAKTIFARDDIAKVFVSQYLKDIAENDAACNSGNNSHIIHNYIDNTLFAYHAKSANDRSNILMIRSFERANYACDIAVEALQMMQQQQPQAFAKLTITIIGTGKLFRQITQPLTQLDNVTLSETHLAHDEMVKLFREHGVFLAPTRHDTQGVLMGEAMSCGLVPITNRVAAIPEFADNTCALLVADDNPQAFAEAIWAIQDDAEGFLQRSAAAAARVRQQCSLSETVAKELSLLGLATNYTNQTVEYQEGSTAWST